MGGPSYARPNTVGYSWSPTRGTGAGIKEGGLYGQRMFMIEDRNSHISGTRLEQHNEVQQIASFLAR